MPFSAHDRDLLRGLARQVAEVASLPIMADRRRRWISHNSLRSTEPMMLIFPEGSWEELLPESAMQCEDETARGIERALGMRLYTYRHFQDDSVITGEWIEPAVITSTGWGYEPARTHSDTPRGAYHVDPVLVDYTPPAKILHFPELVYDEQATQRKVETMQELFGDLLTVRLKGVSHISYHLTAQYMNLRGLLGLFTDMVDAPAYVHEVMAFFEEGHHRVLRQWEALNLLSLNNDNTYHSSGGNGHTDELPAAGFTPERVRPCDMWASAEAQEFAPVGPAMHVEFVMQYENRLLAPFGLTGYGCCEDLSRKLDDVLTIPHIRRISISPFADVDRSAARLGNRAIFSWKPHPSHLVGRFDEDAIGAYIRHTIDVCRAHGCVLEMILKDTHTCEHQPARFDAWTRIARAEIQAG